MFRNCVLNSIGSIVDSQPPLACESLRKRYACPTVPRSPLASGQFRPEVHSADVVDSRVRGLSGQVRTKQNRNSGQPLAVCRAIASARFAHQRTTTAHFSRHNARNHWDARLAVACAAQGYLAHRLFALCGNRKTEGLEDRHLLPKHHHPCLSRSHEEGNVDQCVATGGMPDRDH